MSTSGRRDHAKRRQHGERREQPPRRRGIPGIGEIHRHTRQSRAEGAADQLDGVDGRCRRRTLSGVVDATHRPCGQVRPRDANAGAGDQQRRRPHRDQADGCLLELGQRRDRQSDGHYQRRDGDVRAWLFTILHNLAINQFRQSASRGRHVPIDETNEDSFGEAAAQGRGIALDQHSARGRDGFTGARKAGDIGFASLRGGTVTGDHSVIFAGPYERIELSHRAEDRMIFAHGALKAAMWAHGKKPGLYSMADVLGLRDF